MLLNRKCNYCGNEYYICRACISINSWKNVCCSRECFINMQSLDGVRPIILENGDKNMTKTILRAELKDGKTYDIIGYDVDLGRFDCDGGRTLTYDEVKFFYITPEVLKDMVGTVKVQTETKTKANIKKNEVITKVDTVSEKPVASEQIALDKVSK